jgi:3-dehydroquinate synthase
MPDPVMVSHALGAYPVLVETGIINRLSVVIGEQLPGRRVAMITDTNVRGHYQAGRLATRQWTGETLTIPPGEASKSRETWTRLTDELLGLGFGRDSGLIGLGGGVVGDLTGFVAATYMRGVPYVLLPTTLLAMLDASVGGKTGVNVPQGKNLIGAFHQPAAVLADPLALMTLPEREYRAGLAEAVKHGLIADATYFEWMEDHADAILGRDPETVAHLVHRSVEIKAEVVSGDEREAGRRAILNAGHTVAHALERLSEYQFPHGEAVALGLLVECAIAEQLKISAPGLGDRVAGLLSHLGLPRRLTGNVEPESILRAMTTDKKNLGWSIRFALASEVGRMHQTGGWTTAVDKEQIRKAVLRLQN